jgi:tetratricopeptide (TPR) repeat protein
MNMNTPTVPDSNHGSAKPSKRSQLLAGFVLVTVIACAFMAYAQGLPGQFMFDDYPNLQTLSQHGGVKDLASLKLYLDEQFAGPTGRPISMLSFLIDVREWPADAGAVKFKNVLIHLLNGVLLFWLLTEALKQSKLAPRSSAVLWIATITTVWWILHPLHVSTVLYAIQRMAQLSTLFALAGLIGYVLGRAQLSNSPRRGIAIMGASLVLGTVLSTFSKENGALLPMLALVLETTLLKSGQNKEPPVAFKVIFLWLPAAAIGIYLVQLGLTPSVSTVELRGFTPLERLLTESRVLFEYLGHLVVPQWHTSGVFRDSHAISRSLFSPPVTALAVLGVVALLGIGLSVRRRFPLLAAAILFFLAGHLLESTVVPLELYFEHRNYLPSILLFLPIAQLLVLAGQSAPKAATGGTTLIMVVMAGFLVARAELWSDRSTLYLMWADENPTSPRAQLAAANILQQHGADAAAMEHLRRALAANPDNLALNSQMARIALGNGELTNEALRQLEKAASQAAFSTEAIVSLTRLSNEIARASQTSVSAAGILRVWEALYRNQSYQVSKDTRARIQHEMGRLHAKIGNSAAAVRHFNNALDQAPRVKTAMMQAAILATHGDQCSALDQLSRAESLLDSDTDVRRNRSYYAGEIHRLRNIMQSELDDSGNACDSE